MPADPHGHSHGHSHAHGKRRHAHGKAAGHSLRGHSQEEEEVVEGDVWNRLLGFLKDAENAQVQLKKSDVIAASFLGVTKTKNKWQAATRLIIDMKRAERKKANEEKLGLVDNAEEFEVRKQEEPAMEPETMSGEPKEKISFVDPARLVEAADSTKDELIRQLLLERDQLRCELDAWQRDQTSSLKTVKEHGMQVPEVAPGKMSSRSALPVEPTSAKESQQMICTLEKELQEKAKQLGEKLAEVETLQDEVSQQQAAIKNLESKNAQLEGSLCLAEMEAQKLLFILRPHAKLSSKDTKNIHPSQASTSSNPITPQIPTSARTLAHHLNELNSPRRMRTGMFPGDEITPSSGSLAARILTPRRLGLNWPLSTSSASWQP